jgi:precorrin-6B C5,15-methyltransferase / cobalt-precorrin-6B C5,C15-methyltransferase
MSDPWLVLVGLNEDGLDGLSMASRRAIEEAEFVFGGPRHLDLAGAGVRGQAWPVPFSVDPVLALRGRRVVVLASGDPFWFGAGGSLMAHLTPGDWVSYPAPSCFSLAASALGWRLEETRCLGLHAAPFERLLPHFQRGQPILCTLRDGKAPAALADWLVSKSAGDTRIEVLSRLGGPLAQHHSTTAGAFDLAESPAPVLVGLMPERTLAQSRVSGLADEEFAHDGQITKRPVRALTLSALAPRPGEVLWDLGAGSGSISVEWCLAGGAAIAVEARTDRVANIARNIDSFGLAQILHVIEARISDGVLPPALAALPPPDAVFIGGGGGEALLETLFQTLPRGTRLVMNGVTLETEALLARWHALKGGNLLRIDLAQATPLGQMRGWTAARPVVQWSVVL